MDKPKFVGLTVGMVLGIAFAFSGPLAALITALFGLIGWLVGKYATGELTSVDRLLERFLVWRNHED